MVDRNIRIILSVFWLQERKHTVFTKNDSGSHELPTSQSEQKLGCNEEIPCERENDRNAKDLQHKRKKRVIDETDCTGNGIFFDG
jgi:hypothetical protein